MRVYRDGGLVGLVAAAIGTLTLLALGAVGGRGLDILAGLGMGPWPSLVRAVTGISLPLSYLLSHTAAYLLAGIVSLAIARLADRIPVLLTGMLLVALGMEFSFLVFMTGWQAVGGFDQVTWRAVVTAHVVADVALALGILRVHPTLRQALRRAYEE